VTHGRHDTTRHDTFVYTDGRSLSILVNGAAGNFLATAEDLKTKGFRVGALSCCRVAVLPSCGGCPSMAGVDGRERERGWLMD